MIDLKEYSIYCANGTESWNTWLMLHHMREHLHVEMNFENIKYPPEHACYWEYFDYSERYNKDISAWVWEYNISSDEKNGLPNKKLLSYNKFNDIYILNRKNNMRIKKLERIINDD